MKNADTPAIDYVKLVTELSNENQCSEWCVFTWCWIQYYGYGVDHDQMSIDFGEFLMKGNDAVPVYIKHHFRSNVLEA